MWPQVAGDGNSDCWQRAAEGEEAMSGQRSVGARYKIRFGVSGWYATRDGIVVVRPQRTKAGALEEMRALIEREREIERVAR